jgi:homoserine acetyltransferase
MIISQRGDTGLSQWMPNRRKDKMVDYELFELGDVVLQSAVTLRGAKLAYKTFGTLNARKDNVIVYPTWYSGQH